MKKHTKSWLIIAVVMTQFGARDAFAAKNADAAGGIEEQQAAAGAIVAKAKALAKISAERPIPGQASAESAQSLLKACPDGVRRRFLRSIVLVDNKLAGATVDEIKAHLGESRYGNLLSSLGVGTAADHAKYKCASRATCEPSLSAICTSNCRSSGVFLTASGEDVGFVSIENILKDRSEEDRNRFLDSLTFVEGRVVSRSLDGNKNRTDKTVLAAALK